MPMTKLSHHTRVSPSDKGSVGWAACSCVHEAFRATRGPTSSPAPRPMGHGTGRMASRPMRTAPRSATITTESMPGTQAAVAVDRAIINVRSRMSSADHATAPVIEARVWLHILRGQRAAKPLADADCIPSPLQAREVIPAADYVQVDVLPEIEAGVSIRAAEAGGVQVENHHGGPAPLNHL